MITGALVLCHCSHLPCVISCHPLLNRLIEKVNQSVFPHKWQLFFLKQSSLLFHASDKKYNLLGKLVFFCTQVTIIILFHSFPHCGHYCGALPGNVQVRTWKLETSNIFEYIRIYRINIFLTPLLDYAVRYELGWKRIKKSTHWIHLWTEFTLQLELKGRPNNHLVL